MCNLIIFRCLYKNGRSQKQKIGGVNPLSKFASLERLATFNDWISKKKGGGYGWT